MSIFQVCLRCVDLRDYLSSPNPSPNSDIEGIYALLSNRDMMLVIQHGKSLSDEILDQADLWTFSGDMEGNLPEPDRPELLCA